MTRLMSMARVQDAAAARDCRACGHPMGGHVMPKPTAATEQLPPVFTCPCGCELRI